MNTGSLINHLYSSMTINAPAPEVGQAATMLLWSDRTPGTVVEVNMKGRYIVVQEDTAIVTSGPSLGAPEYRYERNPNGHLNYFRKAKNGRWVNVARNPETKRFVQLGTLGLLLGERQKYWDPSF
jgi:hypothetical protein